MITDCFDSYSALCCLLGFCGDSYSVPCVPDTYLSASHLLFPPDEVHNVLQLSCICFVICVVLFTFAISSFFFRRGIPPLRRCWRLPWDHGLRYIYIYISWPWISSCENKNSTDAQMHAQCWCFAFPHDETFLL